MKKTFEFNRFWQVMKWTILSEKKSIITAFIAFSIGFLAIQLFSCFTIFDITHALGPTATYAGMATCSVVISFMAGYYNSGVLGNARTSQQRTTALMLPASNLEKFTARIIYCCIIMPLLLYLAVYAATGVRMLMELIASHGSITSGLSTIFNPDVFVNDHDIELNTFLYIALTLWTTSIFVLGGVFFRQRPFIWTNVTMFILAILFITVVFYLVRIIGEDSIKQFLMQFRNMTLDTFELILTLILTAFAVFNIWISYRLYKRLQVVQHKWFNV